MEYSDGYVAFIDILGFSNYVSEEQNAEKVAGLFTFVEKFCYLFNTSPKLGVNVSFFSDSIVLSSSDFFKLIVPIYIAETYLKSELQLLFRGGITRGKYYHADGITFGPAVVSAYHLENVANYSRIIVDEKIVTGEYDFVVFRDIDGKHCLNLAALIVESKNSYGIDGVNYPDGDPATNILDSFKAERTAILSAIKKYSSTAVIEKYCWRVRPFNYTCEQIAKKPSELKVLTDNGYTIPNDFSSSLRALKITNLDIEQETV